MAAMGAFFIAYLWKQYRIARETWQWIETPCTVMASTIDDSDRTQHGSVKYRFEIRYRYRIDGAGFIGEKVKRKRPIASSKRARIESWQERYPAGSETLCFVDPADPARAILIRDTKAALYSIWMPALFVVAGLGIAWSGFRKGRS